MILIFVDYDFISFISFIYFSFFQFNFSTSVYVNVCISVAKATFLIFG